MSEESNHAVNVTDEHIRAALDLQIRSHVRVSGISKIHPKVIAKDLEAVKRCTTIEEVVMTMGEVKSRWMNLGLFRSVEFNLEPTQDGAPNDVCVHIDVQEAKPKQSIGVFTTDTSMPEVTVALENMLGGRYSIKGNYIPPASRVHSLSLSVLSNVPFLGQGAEYYFGRRTESKTFHLASAEHIEEVKAATTNQKGGMMSEVSVGFQRRTLVAKNRGELPEEALPDFSTTDKGYIRHSLTLSNLAYHANAFLYNRYPLPIYGGQLNMVSEFAGGLVGGDYTFIKSEVQGSKYWPLGPYFSLQWSARVAGIYPFMQGRIPVNDRLFLSNCHVRGFKSVGPSTLDLGNATSRFAATGGNALWATSLNLNFPLPFFPDNGLAAVHTFVNAGQLRMVDSLPSLCDSGAWLRSCACSFGAGIVITRIPLFGVAPSGRFELNFCVPIGVNKDGSVVLRNGKRNLFDRVRFGLVWSSEFSL